MIGNLFRSASADAAPSAAPAPVAAVAPVAPVPPAATAMPAQPGANGLSGAPHGFEIDANKLHQTNRDLPPRFIVLTSMAKPMLEMAPDMYADVAIIAYPPELPPNSPYQRMVLRLTTPGYMEADSESFQRVIGLGNQLRAKQLQNPRSINATRELICFLNGVDPQKMAAHAALAKPRRDDDAERRARADKSENASSPHNKFFTEILNQAVKYDTADIHIEARYGTDPVSGKNGSRIRFRIDGDVVDMPFAGSSMEPGFLRAMVGHVFNEHSEGKSDQQYNPNNYQSAQVTDRKIAGRLIRGRYQTFDVAGSIAANGDKPFDLVMRVLYADRVDIPTLEQLGFLPHQVAMLKRFVDAHSRLGCVSGKVGSGKSTTLRTLFAMLPDHYKKYSAEDPVEYYHPNTTPLPLSDKEALPKILNSLKRGDLSALLMGEVRNKDTLSLIRNITFSGHQVLTTTHSESALGQIPYFLSPEMQMSTYEMANPAFIGVLFHQALCKVLCECAHSGEKARALLGTERLNKLEKDYRVPVDNLRARNEEGCPKCRNELASRVGYLPKKMDVLAEMFEPDLDDLQLIEQHKLIDLTIKWRESHAAFDSDDCTGKTFQEVALYKALQGRLDLRSIEQKGRPFVNCKVYGRK